MDVGWDALFVVRIWFTTYVISNNHHFLSIHSTWSSILAYLIIPSLTTCTHTSMHCYKLAYTAHNTPSSKHKIVVKSYSHTETSLATSGLAFSVAPCELEVTFGSQLALTDFHADDPSELSHMALPSNLARVLCRRGGRTDAAPLLRSLHWLPVKLRITYKTAVLTHKVLTTSTPPYLHDILTVAAPARPMRSASAPLLFVPRVRTELARRAFSVAGPTVLNSLPPKIRLSHSINIFKRHLKTHIFTMPNLSASKRLCIQGH